MNKENSTKFIKKTEKKSTSAEICGNDALCYLDSEYGEESCIDNTLTDCGGGYEAAKRPYKTRFAKSLNEDKTLRLEKGDTVLEWEFVRGQNEKSLPAVISTVNNVSRDSVITYEEAIKNVDLQYCLCGGGIKENFIVKAPLKDYTFAFKLFVKGLEIAPSEEPGGYEIYTETVSEGGIKVKTAVYTIPAPFMYDGIGTKSNGVRYELEPLGEGEYIFRVVADSDWISAPGRTFPVTVDPQIVTKNIEFFSYQNYNALSPFTNWVEESNALLRVGYELFKRYKAVLNVKRSRYTLLRHKLTKASIILKSTSVSFMKDGQIRADGKKYEIISGYNTVELDVTRFFRESGGDFDLEITADFITDVSFYTSGENRPQLKLEYMTDENTRETTRSFPLAGGIAQGEANLVTGDIVTSFSDTYGGDSPSGFALCHAFNSKAVSSGSCGLNFRLNTDERLDKFSGDAGAEIDYIYTDPRGVMHAFKEYYYYINNGVRNNVTKSSVTVEPDGELTYGGYRVYKDLRSATGLTLISKPEGFKHADLLETRGEELKRLEESVYSYKSSLNKYIKFKPEYITKNDNKLGDIDNAEADIAAEMREIFKPANVQSPDSFNAFIAYTGEELIADIHEALSYFGCNLQRINYSHNASSSSIANEVKNFKSQARLMQYQGRTLTARQYDNSEYLRKLYKEYYNLYTEWEKVKKATPINFLTDGTVVKGYSESGELVSIIDLFGHETVIERGENGRTEKITEGGRQVALVYNERGYLTSVTDFSGRKTEYAYSGSRLAKVTFPDGKTLEFSYDAYYNIVKAASSEAIYTTLSYNNGKFMAAVDYTDAVRIGSGGIEKGSSAVMTDLTTLSYDTGKTVVTDIRGNKEYFFFDDKWVLLKRYLERDGKIAEAERYERVPFVSEKTEYAKKTLLGISPFASFDFQTGDYDLTELDAFNNPITVTRSHFKGGVDFDKSVSVYTYADDRKLKSVRTTETVNFPVRRSYTCVKKFSYNAYGQTVRTESFIEGEEKSGGIQIEEYDYNEKGGLKKSAVYNSLDTSSKLISESEYSDSGLLTAESAEPSVGIRYDYDAGSGLVKSAVSGGRGICYCRDLLGRVTAVTASGEEDGAIRRQYTAGYLTGLTDGATQIDYVYNGQGEKTSTLIDGATVRCTTFSKDVIEEGMKMDKTVVMTADGVETVDFTDMRGNLLKRMKGKAEQFRLTYTPDDQLQTVTDRVTGKTTSAEYDSNYENILSCEVRNRDGSVSLSQTNTYTLYGKLEKEMTTGEATGQYVYSYDDNAEEDLNNITFSHGEGTVSAGFSPKYDCLKRIAGRTLLHNGIGIADENYQYVKRGDRTSGQISCIRYGRGLMPSMYSQEEELRYSYDSSGNISKIYENGQLQASYSYDGVGRLKREDNKALNKTAFYGYDESGNLLYRYETAYTRQGYEEIAESELIASRYGYKFNKLVSYNGQQCNYDSLLNPIQYRDKATVFEGKLMKSYDGNTFTYDAFGRRTGKNAIKFLLDARGRIIKQNDGLEMFYDHTGAAGLVYENMFFYFRKNAQGDITALLDSSGDIMVKYVYDAWGNHKVYRTDGTEVKREDLTEESIWTDKLAILNPYRYRGYYYDVETGLFYTPGRYYDPEVGRWINADDVAYLDPETIGGLNLYSYCLNNPISYIDPDGHAPKWWQWLLFGIGATLVVAATVVVSIATFGTGTAFASLGGAILLGAAKGAIIGAAIGSAVGIVGGAIYSGVTGADMGDSILQGFLMGFGGGAIVGAVIGGAVGGVQFGTFGSKASLNTHLTKHGTKMGYSNASEYAKGAKYVIKNGTKVSYTYKGKLTTGYIRFLGQGGGANYAFVGMHGTRAATFGIRSVSELVRLGIPWLMI